MRYAQIRNMDVSNGEGLGASLFVQGCHFHCKGCHNPEQWSFDGGKLYTKKEEAAILEIIDKSYIKRFSILGGEPLETSNLSELICLIKKIKQKRPDIKIWLYTGYTWEELQNNSNEAIKEILNNIDVLIDGQFIEEEKDLSLRFRGSRNQRLIYLAK